MREPDHCGMSDVAKKKKKGLKLNYVIKTGCAY